jgi:hypothetical protein
MMKAKYIKKIREKIKRYHPFVIHTAIHLFGEPYSEEERPIIYALPGDGVDAVRKYCRWYRRRYKKFHPNYSRNFNPTTCSNGYFEAIDLETGFKHYVW